MNTLILQDLINASPQIQNRIDELSHSVLEDQSDPYVLQQMLINEAFTMLIDLLNDSGIRFHVDLHDIQSDRYNMKYVISLYTDFTPHKLKEYLDIYQNFSYVIQEVLDTTVDTECIVKLIEARYLYEKSTYNRDMYVYLHDKIVSDLKYVDSIREIVADYEESIVDMWDSDDNEAIARFIDLIGKEREWFRKKMNDMIFNGNMPIDYSKSNQLTAQYCLNYTLPRYIALLSKYKGLITTNRYTLHEFLKKIHRISEFHDEYYSDSELHNIPIEMVTSIILMQFTDQRLFDIVPNFDRLMKFAHEDIPVKSIINMIPQQNSLS